uniref:Stress-associated endoplasmic reticulum protein n=1 Tax=Oryctolagus cuniculus TaxID=9986 RepID=A0A5F9D5Q3_RABIT
MKTVHGKWIPMVKEKHSKNVIRGSSFAKTSKNELKEKESVGLVIGALHFLVCCCATLQIIQVS